MEASREVVISEIRKRKKLGQDELRSRSALHTPGAERHGRPLE